MLSVLLPCNFMKPYKLGGQRASALHRYVLTFCAPLQLHCELSLAIYHSDHFRFSVSVYL